MPKLTTNPQAESFYGYSPYMAMGNNPIMMVDPDGELPFLVFAAAAIIGGSINVAANWDNIDGNWFGRVKIFWNRSCFRSCSGYSRRRRIGRLWKWCSKWARKRLLFKDKQAEIW